MPSLFFRKKSISLCIFSVVLFSPFAMNATEQNFGLLQIQEQSLRNTYKNHQDTLNNTEVQDAVLMKTLRTLENKSRALQRTDFTPENIEQVNTLIQEGKLHLYARAKSYTPVLYTDTFATVFGGSSGGLLLDDYFQIDPLEFVAFPLTSFNIRSMSFDQGNLILRIISDEYNYVADTGHYIDARFVDISWRPVAEPESRTILPPNAQTVIKKLRKQVGKIYVWGGNAQGGVKKLLSYYRPTSEIDALTEKKWILDGFDCSGLIFWATNGYTPRNTSNLVNYGTGLVIAGKTKEEIKELLQPLDIIVWVGHNMIVIDNNEIIESRVDFGNGPDKENGVRIRSIDDVLDEVLAKRTAVNTWKDTVPEGKKKFVIRRWINQ